MTEWGIDTLFNPGKRHMDEEKRRLQSTREEVGDSSGGRRIDLEGGKVTISRRPKHAPAADDEDGSALDGSASDEAESAGDEAAGTESAGDESAHAAADTGQGEQRD